MNGYEFMAQNPYLTATLFAIGGITITNMFKYMFGAFYGVNNEQKNQEEES